jgi:hypothetical protein
LPFAELNTGPVFLHELRFSGSPDPFQVSSPSWYEGVQQYDPEYARYVLPPRYIAAAPSMTGAPARSHDSEGSDKMYLCPMEMRLSFRTAMQRLCPPPVMQDQTK